MGSHSKWNLEIQDEYITNPFLRTENAQKVLAAIRQRYSRVPRSTLSSRLSYRIKQEEISSQSSATDEQVNQAQLVSKFSQSSDCCNSGSFTCALQKRLVKKTTENCYQKLESVNGNNSSSVDRKVTALSSSKRNSGDQKKIPQPNCVIKPASHKRQVLSVELISSQQREQVKKNLLSAEEVACTLMFEDGASQLRPNTIQTKKRQGKAAKACAIVFAFPWAEMESNFEDEMANVLQGQLVFVKITLVTENTELEEWIRELVNQLMQSSTRKICYGAQEIASCLMKKYSYDTKTVCSDWIFMDVKIASWLLNPDKPPKDYSDLLEKVDMKLESKEDKDEEELLRLDLSTLGPAILTLYNRLKDTELWELYWTLEMPLCPILAVMESEGINLDTQVLLKSSNILKGRIKTLETEAHKAAGRSFLINSSHQLRQVLFEELKLDKKCDKALAKTAANSYTSTSEAVLLDLQHLHPLPRIVLEYRQLVKLKSTYFDGMLPFVTNGMIHTTWEHTAAATGRLTSANPNLQNIPKQAMQIPTHQYIVGKENESVSILPREAFHSKEGWSFLAADFQSIELRLLAHLSNDTALLKVFNENNSSDVFITLTSQWLNKRSESVQFQEREHTKRIVYSVIYGVGRERLAKNIGVSVDKAKEFMKSFLDKFPGIGLFTRKCIEECKKNGYVCTIFKRKRWFPHINAPQFNLRAQAERQAVNFVVQGSAADICKSSMIEVVRSFKKDPSIRSRLLLQIHDELLFEVPDGDIPRVIGIIQSAMENSVKLYSEKSQLKVLLPVTVSTGKKWSHMTTYDITTNAR